MHRINRWLAMAAGCLVLLLDGRAGADEAQAFIAEVKGKANIERAGGGREPAATGGQLTAGDALRVDEGRAVLIYLSGRSVAVAAGESHRIEAGENAGEDLMKRLANTLGEIAGPQNEADRPVVHGMARDLAGILGALPANTRISRRDFVFTWDPAEEVEEFEFSLETEDGQVLAKKTVKGTQLAAHELMLEPGRRYVWQVQEEGSFVPRSSGRNWVDVATEEEAKALQKSMAEIESRHRGDTRALFEAANFFRQGYFYETEQSLAKLQEKRALSELESRLLKLTYVKMERWDRLPEPEKEANEKEKGEGEE